MSPSESQTLPTSGPVVTVTGGANGVGAAVVDRLLEQGATVHVLDVADPAPRDGVHAVRCDLADPDSIDAALSALPDRVDAHVNVAGVVGPTPADWVLRVNFLGPRLLTESLFARIAPGGSVVNVSSTAGRQWQKRRQVVEPLVDTISFDDGVEWAAVNEERWSKDPYTFSKQCLTLWTLKSAARGVDGTVRVNAVSPGAVQTRLSASFRDIQGQDYSDWMRSITGRSAEPREIAEPIVWLAVGDCRWINGADLVVDRGFRAGIEAGWVEIGSPPGR
jgi:NAD(P)-dependent dehydrogenase (short-subunit alcohol dehydrogenase family)